MGNVSTVARIVNPLYTAPDSTRAKDLMTLTWMGRIPLKASRIVRVLCIGDSFTYGTGSASTPVLGYPDLLRTYLGTDSAGPGYINIGDDRWTKTSTWWTGQGYQGCLGIAGIPNWSGTTNGTASITETATTAKIYVKGYGSGCTLTWTIDGGGGSSQAIGGADAWTTITVALGGLASHTLALSFGVSGQCTLGGVEFTSAATGIEVCNVGVPQASTTYFTPLTTAFLNLGLQPDLSIIMLGLNDWNAQTALSTFEANLTTIKTTLSGYGGVGFCTLPNAWNTDNKAIVKAMYSTSVRNVALAGSCPVFDFENYWGTWAENNTAGLMNSGVSYHPNDAGHASIKAGIATQFMPKEWF